MPRFVTLLTLTAVVWSGLATAQETTTTEADATADPAAAVETPAEPAPLVDQQVTIVNQSGQMLMRFEATPVLPAAAQTETAEGAEAPPPDPRAAAGGELLKGGVVSAGNYGILTVPGGASVCTFKLISSLADGRTIEADVDICLNPVYTLLP